MKKKMVTMLCLVLAMCSFAGCTSTKMGTIPEEPLPKQKEIVEIPKEPEKEIPEEEGDKEQMLDKEEVVAPAKTPYDVYGFVMDSKEENVLFSPMSLDYALGMVATGSKEDTLGAFENYFGRDIGQESLWQSRLMKEYESNGYVEINIANEFVNDSSMQLRDDYRNDLGVLYNANIVSDHRFLTEADVVASKVNQFCDENTNGMIREIVDESTVRESTAIVLNALYFKGDWEVPFAPNNVREDVFYGTSGEETATMMSGSGSTYFEDQEGNVGFAKSYVGGQFEFVGILPSETICDENGNFDVSDIDIENLLASRTSEYEVDYKMPKFKAETTLNLVEPLSETVLAPTIGTNANYDGISETKIYVTDIIQKVVVNVNETGTEASAVTVIISKTTSLNKPTPKYVALDRPFLFLIYDKVNNEILFMGKMTTLQ